MTPGTEQVPLYLGIPLAALCIAACVFIILAGLSIWKSREK
jgi:hypothetical protein